MLPQHTAPDTGGNASAGEGFLGAAFRRQLQAIKNGLPIEDLAREHGVFKPSGAGKLTGRCIAPDHEDRTPSMVLYTEKRRFHCFGCGRSGDVIDLAQLLDPGAETWVIMLDLSARYGIERPERPPTWFARQERQAPVRRTMERIRVERAQRRLYRWMCAPAIAQFEDERERRLEEAIAWEECGVVARMVARFPGAREET
jgi:DNA primase